MNNTLKAIQILEQYKKLLLNQTEITLEELELAIKQLKDVEHYTHYTTGCYATDKPDLFKSQIKSELMFKLDFWECLPTENIKEQIFAPYVDETVTPEESYLVFCQNHSPWNEHDSNMIRVHSNEESHKLLNILEAHFGIKNHHKG